MRDSELIERVRRGEPAAGRELALRLMPRCKRVVRAIVGAHPDSDDIVQQCLVDVLRGAGSFRGESTIETWATRICVRRTMKAAAKARRLADDIESTDEVSADDVAAEAEAAQLLREALPRPLPEYLDALPDVHREALVLRYGFGYSVREIAALSGATPNTIKVRLYQALKKTRERIASDAESRPEVRR